MVGIAATSTFDRLRTGGEMDPVTVSAKLFAWGCAYTVTYGAAGYIFAHTALTLAQATPSSILDQRTLIPLGFVLIAFIAGLRFAWKAADALAGYRNRIRELEADRDKDEKKITQLERDLRELSRMFTRQTGGE